MAFVSESWLNFSGDISCCLVMASLRDATLEALMSCGAAEAFQRDQAPLAAGQQRCSCCKTATGGSSEPEVELSTSGEITRAERPWAAAGPAAGQITLQHNYHFAECFYFCLHISVGPNALQAKAERYYTEREVLSSVNVGAVPVWEKVKW